MKEITGLTVKLLLICAVMAALLAAVNQVTEPVIAVNNQKTLDAAMAQVMPGSSSFTPLDAQAFTPSETGVALDSIYRADNGYVASVICHEGYGGDVSVLVGITDDNKVCQAKVMSMSETPGLGAKSTTPEFINQYSGLSQGIEVVKNAAPAGNQIQAISGATITSRAVTKAVNTALEAAAQAASRKGGADA